MSTAQPFRVAIDQRVLDDLAHRLAAARLPPSPEKHGWDDGVDLTWLAGLLDHWRDEFDWRTQEAGLNRFAQFTAEVDGNTLHFVHEHGQGPAPLPLVLVHGWPDNVDRFHKLIPLLIDPAAHGGEASDAFTVVAPSLPGFGFSERLRGSSVFAFGALFHKLMERLGHTRYGAHGGDIGAIVCEEMGRSHADRLVGIHLTDVPLQHAEAPPKNLTAAERNATSPRSPPGWPRRVATCTRRARSHGRSRRRSTTRRSDSPPGFARSSATGATAAATSRAALPRTSCSRT